MLGKHITYTNLSPGNYTLKVRPIISGKGKVEETCLNIHVAPPSMPAFGLIYYIHVLQEV